MTQQRRICLTHTSSLIGLKLPRTLSALVVINCYHFQSLISIPKSNVVNAVHSSAVIIDMHVACLVILIFAMNAFVDQMSISQPNHRLYINSTLFLKETQRHLLPRSRKLLLPLLPCIRKLLLHHLAQMCL